MDTDRFVEQLLFFAAMVIGISIIQQKKSVSAIYLCLFGTSKKTNLSARLPELPQPATTDYRKTS